MLFNSLQFALFLPVVVALYFVTPRRFRWILLLAASYYFYAAWKVEYLALILASTLVDYFAGLMMGRTEDRRKRLPFLLLSLATNLGLLFAFKYFNFFNESLQAVLGRFDMHFGSPAFAVLLPVGISFYTFQTLAYSIDVYRDRQKPERHLGYFALYVAFFPQLVAGPIERAQHLLPQFREDHALDYVRVTSGLRLMFWGLFKKIVIADRLAIYVNEVYNNPGMYEGVPVILATYFFAFQIYCDFSGYSDIAIGTARMMGFDLILNFRQPYFAKSIREFWSRWHISLSTWFRDYLYIPLGGGRVVRWRWYYNLFIVFLVSGLWHGAAWTFVIWGALHGGYLITSIVTRPSRDRLWTKVGRGVDAMTQLRVPSLIAASRWLKVSLLRDLLAMVMTFHLVLVAWVFFRANSLADVGILLQHAMILDLSDPEVAVALGKVKFLFVLGCIGLMELVHIVQSRTCVNKLIAAQPTWLRWSVYTVAIFTLVAFGEYGAQPFIYFQF